MFTPTVDGTVSAIRFFKGVENTGTHVGTLWTAAGVPLGSVTFQNETPSGWQRATLPEPVPVTAGTAYVVSYYAPNGHYAATPGFFNERPDLGRPDHAGRGGHGSATAPVAASRPAPSGRRATSSTSSSAAARRSASPAGRRRPTRRASTPARPCP